MSVFCVKCKRIFAYRCSPWTNRDFLGRSKDCIAYPSDMSSQDCRDPGGATNKISSHTYSYGKCFKIISVETS